MTGAAPALLAATAVIGPQLLGGVFGWGAAIITALAATAALAAAWAAHQDENRQSVGAVGAVALLGLGWTLLQAIPLPRAVTGWLQPTAVQMADEAASLLGGDAPGWVALSISPGSTLAQVVTGAGLVAAFFAAATLVALGHRRRVLMAVGVSGLVMAGVALIHAGAGAERVFGVYEPWHQNSRLLAPLVNQNQLSGFLAMCAPVLVGLGLDASETRVKAGWLTAAAVVGACALMAVSRGGAASLVVGFLALALFGSVRRGGEGGRRGGTPLLLIGASFCAAIGLGLYVAADSLYRNFETSGLDKLELGALGIELALDHPLVGVGRGAFSAAFVSRHGTNTRATNPENLLAQWSSEWGLVVAVILLGVLTWGIFRATRRARAWAHLGGAAGLVSIFAHDLVDFSLELPGVAIVAAALVGGVVSPGRRQRGPRAGRWTLGRVAGGAGVAAAVAVLALGFSLDARSVYGLQRTLEDEMRAQNRDAFRATLEEAVRVHPAEPTFPLLAGSEAAQRGDPTALRWLNRAMVLAPGWGAPHEEVVRFLLGRGHLHQAIVEVREAASRGRPAAARLLAPPLERHPDRADLVIRVLGEDPLGDELLGVVAAELPPTSPACLAIDAHLVGHGVVAARLRTARRALSEERGQDALDALAGLESDDPVVLGVRARALVSEGRPEEAVALLRDLTGPAALLEARARAEAAAGDEEAMLATLTRLRGRAAGSATRIAAIWVLEGRLQEEQGNDFAALRAYGRADRMDPSSGALRRIARVSERVGDLGRAYRAWGDLCRAHGARSSPCRERDRLLAALRESRREAGQPVGVP